MTPRKEGVRGHASRKIFEISGFEITFPALYSDNTFGEIFYIFKITFYLCIL